jgi:hypothetical protein
VPDRNRVGLLGRRVVDRELLGAASAAWPCHVRMCPDTQPAIEAPWPDRSENLLRGNLSGKQNRRRAGVYLAQELASRADTEFRGGAAHEHSDGGVRNAEVVRNLLVPRAQEGKVEDRTFPRREEGDSLRDRQRPPLRRRRTLLDRATIHRRGFDSSVAHVPNEGRSPKMTTTEPIISDEIPNQEETQIDWPGVGRSSFRGRSRHRQ